MIPVEELSSVKENKLRLEHFIRVVYLKADLICHITSLRVRGVNSCYSYSLPVQLILAGTEFSFEGIEEVLTHAVDEVGVFLARGDSN